MLNHSDISFLLATGAALLLIGIAVGASLVVLSAPKKVDCQFKITDGVGNVAIRLTKCEVMK